MICVGKFGSMNCALQESIPKEVGQPLVLWTPNFADLATVAATARMSTIGFGSIDQTPNQSNREDMKQYDVVTNINLGKLLPEKWGIQLPLNINVRGNLYHPRGTILFIKTSFCKTDWMRPKELPKEIPLTNNP